MIIGGIILGARYGAVLGFMFGVTSLINNSLAPVVSSFAFSPLIPLPGTEYGSALALAVCFVPRIFVGVVPRLVYMGLRKAMGNRNHAAVCFTAGVMGSLTNTLLVMHMIFFFFKDAYAYARDATPEIVYNIILGIIAVNGIPEAITAGVIVTVVCTAISRSKIKIL